MRWRIVISAVLLITAFVLFSQFSASCNGRSGFRTDVIVVGAGLSGLTAALVLARAGVNVILLEKASLVGGKLDTKTLGGLMVNMGAQWLFSDISPVIDPYFRALTYQELNKNGAVWDGQYVYCGDGDFPDCLPISDEAKIDFVAAYEKMAADSEIISAGREFYTDSEPENALWSQIEAQTIAEYLAGYHADVIRFWSAQLGGEAGGTAEDLSALLLVGWFGTEDEIPMALAQGGNQRLAESVLADIQNLGVTVVMGADVTEVSEGTLPLVNVTLADGRSYAADYAIVSTPSNVTLEIVPGIAGDKRQALEAVTYGNVAEVALQLRDFPTGDELSTVLFVGHDVSGYLNQTGAILGNPDVGTDLCVSVADPDLLALSDDELVARVAQDLGLVSATFDPAEDVVSYSVTRWARGVPRFTAGYVSMYMTELRVNSGRIFFAGDYTHDPSLLGASWSGMRAADDLLGTMGR